MTLLRKTDQSIVMKNGAVANRYWLRLRGLIGKKEFSEGDGMFFPKNNSIHMWMMSIPIDVLFLKVLVPNREWKVLRTHSRLRAWKVLPVTCLQADDTLELPAGTIERLNLKSGEVLCSDS